MNKMVEKDERTTFIENISYKFGYMFLTYALLLDVVYRGIRFNEAAWDLLALVIVSSFISTIYQYRKQILKKDSIKTAALIMVAAFIIAFIVAFIIKKF